MRLLTSILFSMALSFSGFSQGITGDWHGVLDIPGQQLRLDFHIEKADAGFSASLDSPDQGAFGLPAQSVSLEDQNLTIKWASPAIEYTGVVNAEGTEIKGVFVQGAARLPLVMGREAAEKKEAARPQHPEPPFAYQVEEVTYQNEAAGITLAGTLTVPSTKGPHPAVILISGSGPQNRDEELMGHKPFLVIADYLTNQGIAVLRFDDRGVGESTGDFASATSVDFATDVAAGVEFLKSRADIAAKKIGLVGHSEGGLVAPIVAAESDDVAFLVLLAGPGVPGDQILMRQSELIAKAEGESEEAIALTRKINSKTYEMLRESEDMEKTRAKLKEYWKEELARLPESEKSKFGDADQFIDSNLKMLTSPWFLNFLTYDPAVTLQKVKVPVLALNGEKDLQVPPDQNLAAIATALKAGGNEQVTVKELEGLNHLFQTSTTGKISEYGQLEETFSPVALQLMGDWIKERMK